MGVATVPLGTALRLILAAAAGCKLLSSAALAFPATDADNPSVFSNPPEPAVSDLRHQLQLQSGFGAAASGGGWTFTPRIMGEEFYTDNVLQSPTDRRWDMVTLVTPGITIYGDLPNTQVRLSYAPQFRLDATTPQENSVTQQLIGTGQFTIVPDAFYVDARAFAGAAPAFGGFNGFGTSLTPQFGTPGQSLGLEGLSKQNRTQNSSFSLTPYASASIRRRRHREGRLRVERDQHQSERQYRPVAVSGRCQQSAQPDQPGGGAIRDGGIVRPVP